MATADGEEEPMRSMAVVIIGCVLITATLLAEEGGVDMSDGAQVHYAAGSQQSFAGPEDWFTGKVRVDLLFPENEHTGYSGAYVTFAPGARTAWHLHPGGQHMIVTSGVCWTGTRDGKLVTCETGETVWCPPDIDHWHGASPDEPMTHLVITGSRDGKNVIWKEKVTDAQYNPAGPRQKQASGTSEAAALTGKQKGIIPIAAFAAAGDMDRLPPALGAGLDAGLSVNEIKEILVQIYAYAGFPRSLNGLHAFMAVLKERKAGGLEDTLGREATSLPAGMDKDAYGAKVRAKLAGLEADPPPAPWQEFAPVIDTFLKEHLFADIFARDVLDHRTRELATVAALAAMDGTGGQLRFHLRAAMNVGWTEAQMKGFIAVLAAEVGEEEAAQASVALQAVFEGGK